ncbi:hypothetical protein NQD34_003687, partial [Periophthalmus magnuspinnatus]
EQLMTDRTFFVLDLNKDEHVGVEEWVETLGIFLRGDLNDKSRYTFQVYDSNGDNSISKEEMHRFMKPTNMSKLKFYLEVEEILDDAFKAMDYNHDGKLSYSDFQKVIHKNDMYLEVFGKCLPDPPAVKAFEAHLADLKEIVKA